MMYTKIQKYSHTLNTKCVNMPIACILTTVNSKHAHPPGNLYNHGIKKLLNHW